MSVVNIRESIAEADDLLTKAVYRLEFLVETFKQFAQEEKTTLHTGSTEGVSLLLDDVVNTLLEAQLYYHGKDINSLIGRASTR